MSPKPGGTSWRPGASRHAVETRAQLLCDIRRFFADRNVLEVETPLLSRAGNSDPNSSSISTDSSPKKFLRTSPEYAMKRLLAAGFKDIYELGRVFRSGEKGRFHNPEHVGVGTVEIARPDSVAEIACVVDDRTFGLRTSDIVA